MTTALIFGSNGQDGYYLTKLLEAKNVRSLGISRSLPANVIGSVADYNLVADLIQQEKPEYVFHLAANSSTQHSALWDNHEAIATGTLNILESVSKFSKNTRVFLSGSGLQFENKDLPIDEGAKLVSTSPYVLARNYSLDAAKYYRSLGLKVYFGFLFNHDSPRRGDRHVAQKITKYCRGIDDQKEKLQLGNIDIRKEWTYAGDVVQAMWTLINQENEFDAIIGSGQDYSIKQWLEVCFRLLGNEWQNHVELNSGFVSEYQTLVSNPGRIKSLGWQPKIDFNQLAEMMINQNETLVF